MEQKTKKGLNERVRKAKRRMKAISGIFSLMMFTGTAYLSASDLNHMVEIQSMQQEINGTVSDTEGAPLPGVSVVIKGSTTGVSTDFDGNYNITAGPDATLLFSYIGYASLEIQVGQQTELDVTMQEDVSELDEVVVVG